METKNIVCVACPLGCGLSIELDGKKVISVKGNTCKRGEKYAVTECTAPTRMLTTTVRVLSGEHPVVPVKSATPLPKEKIVECARALCGVTIEAPVEIGDVVQRDILGTGVDIVATNREAKI